MTLGTHPLEKFAPGFKNASIHILPFDGLVFGVLLALAQKSISVTSVVTIWRR